MEKIKVIDMNCMSCVKQVQTALLKNNINAKLNLIDREVEVEKDLKEAAIQIIKQAGFTPDNA